MHAPMFTLPLTVAEYLEFEVQSPYKHEYVAGEVYRMPDVTIRHATLVGNLLYHLHAVARGRSCETFASGLKLAVGGDRIYYPDVMVVCTTGNDDDMVIYDPCLVVEVTSPETARIDRGEKRDAYLTIPSLLGYFVVDHRRRHVTWDVRERGDEWRRGEAAGEAVVPFPSLDATLSLDSVYERTKC